LKVIVAQVGAREHYAVALAFYEQGLLAGLVSDWYATLFMRRLGGFMRGWLGGRDGAAFGAWCEGIPDELVHAFPLRSLLWKWQVRRLAALGRVYEAYAQTDAAFASALTRLKLPPHEVFFGYSYASLEILEAEKKRGVLTVLDQIDPGPAEFRLVAEEMARHPEIAGPPPEFPAANFERNRREWDLADIIIVNSEWSREALIAEGVNPAKIEVLPLAFEADKKNPKSKIQNPKSEQKLRVLWLGQVNVRKGIHYLMAAARLLERENIQFDVVGPVCILPGAVASAPRNMIFHGPVSRDLAAEWYRQSDVFVLPTLSDGFALTQLEAMAHGLPVIVTPNCGQVVEDGKTGFIIPPRDARALAGAILKLAANCNLSASMAPACHEAVKAFSVEAFGKRLVEIIKNSRLPLV
jgi:glycosyltransferase involved in cell wall biosynthesis